MMNLLNFCKSFRVYTLFDYKIKLTIKLGLHLNLVLKVEHLVQKNKFNLCF